MTTNPYGYEIYQFPIEGMRIADVDTEFLKRFLMGPQEVFNRYFSDLDKLKSIPNYVLCPADLLDYLRWIVGFTSELDALVADLTEQELRKMIALAIPFWKQRYLEAGIRAFIRILTGEEVVIKEWHDLRWIVGESLLSIEPGANTAYMVSELHKFFTEIRIMETAQLNKNLLENLLRFNRPISECFLIIYLNFLDDFTATLDMWSTIVGSISIVDKELVLPANTFAYADVTGNDWSNYMARYIGKSVGSNGSLYLFFGFDGVDDGWVIELDFVASAVNLRQYISGSMGSVLASVSPTWIKPDVYYGFRIEGLWDGTNALINFYADNNLVLTYDPGVDVHGTIGVSTESETIGAKFDLIELSEFPLRHTIIDAGG